MAGWKLGPVDGVDLPKCIVCVAPHTSNWDFIVGKLFYTSIGCNAGFLIKKEWFFFPFNLLFNWLGGVPVDRGKRTSVTDQMVERFKTSERFHSGRDTQSQSQLEKRILFYRFESERADRGGLF